MPAKNSFINQVRIALIVAQSLLKKATESGEITQEASSLLQNNLNNSLSTVKQFVNKEKD